MELEQIWIAARKYDTAIARATVKELRRHGFKPADKYGSVGWCFSNRPEPGTYRQRRKNERG